jgi:hypothetical protein
MKHNEFVAALKAPLRGPRGNKDADDDGARKSLLDGYLGEEALAAELDVTTRTLQRWRKLRTGPPASWVGKTPVYRFESVLKWLQATETPMPRRRAAPAE